MKDRTRGKTMARDVGSAPAVCRLRRLPKERKVNPCEYVGPARDALLEAARLVPAQVYPTVLDEVPSLTPHAFGSDRWDFFAGVAGVVIAVVCAGSRWGAAYNDLAELFGPEALATVEDLLTCLRRERAQRRLDFGTAVGAWVVRNVRRSSGDKAHELVVARLIGRLLTQEFSPRAIPGKEPTGSAAA